MPLINCPDCSTQVSDRADKCPKCSRPIFRILTNLSSKPPVVPSDPVEYRETKSKVIIKKEGGCFESCGEFFFVIVILVVIAVIFIISQS
jgi:hypothetical protein